MSAAKAIPKPHIIRREYDLAGLLDENEKLRHLLARMTAVFAKWRVKDADGLLGEVREALEN